MKQIETIITSRALSSAVAAEIIQTLARIVIISAGAAGTVETGLREASPAPRSQ